MRNERERLSGDEIDLFELTEALWGQKLLIGLVTGLVAAGALLYAYLAEPVYEVKVFVQPPTSNDIAQLNYGRGGGSGLVMLTVKDVFDVYLRNLQSESLRRKFFRETYLPALPEARRRGSQDEQYDRYLSAVSLGQVSREGADRHFIKVEASDPKRAVDWAARYVEMAGRLGEDEIVENVMTDAKVKAKNLEQEINIAREGARKLREDQLVQLTEALRVARTIGLERPPIIANNLSGEVSAGMEGSLIYMRGSKALEAEIDNLRNRTSDDPFVRNLRERQESLAFYQSLQVAGEAVKVYRQDGAVDLPDEPVRPNRKIIGILGLVAGGVLGIGMAVLRVLFIRRRALHN
ncbi:Wzz/FepE/Etk N-terminal domain-containing protein [Pseudomonas mosselii]|jgi:chain length determinant protein (polysaccharide antigen chain regulator)|uniref:LPS O-antigen chain length determinant protein WzzB n=2 Tax=Pseudomonas TaxID=286 RepID=UPI0020C3701F|nr:MULTISPECIES: Wzz/FepE/Etk N-terminal domain-containing protein [unclassified Pseudomonas]MCP8632473.1 Wzz/FepE/Etk N-terminal domain-containing protein [Pseudomonas sp. DVZ6]MDC0686568.1 Wzz/FepE/Etk N-terminal domain-containing protein [Mitsuaria sp. RG]MDD7784238.1 Wzz/FepE/Etk N-terminal domain-containing protein [Pseudomonas sp. DVZ24]